MEAQKPFPGPLPAVWLTVGSWLLTVFVGVALLDALGATASLGVGMAIGLGLSGTLATRGVPPPAPERIGLRGFSPRLLLPLLLLVPLALLVSEADNVVRTWLPAESAADPSGAPAGDAALLALEAAIVMVGLAPVVEEFFFRGVLQQGLVAAAGSARGVLSTAALYAIHHGLLIAAPAGPVSAIVGSFATGAVLGYARLVSGSLLAPITVSMLLSASGLLGLQLEQELPIPGFNAPGAHTPARWLVPAVLSVGLGLRLLSRERKRPPAELSRSEEVRRPEDGG